MEDIEYIKDKYTLMPQLNHASNIIKKSNEEKVDEGKKDALNKIISEYKKYLEGVLSITDNKDQDIEKKVEYLNNYYDFLHKNEYDNVFSAQGKFRPTILEEFMFILFNNYIDSVKKEHDKNDVLSSGYVKAYSNLYFKANDFKGFIADPKIGVNEKDQDYAIYRTFGLSINGGSQKDIQIPAVAVEVKTYIDKTMLDSIIATAEKIKSGNPHARFIAVAERYDVSFEVDPAYSRIDQIYVLRKDMRKGEWNNIDKDVVIKLYKDTVCHLERPWFDIANRLKETGTIL